MHNLSENLQTILKYAGFKKPELIGKIPKYENFENSVIDFIQGKLSLFEGFKEEEKQSLFGIFSNNISKFEFSPGEKLELQEFYSEMKLQLQSASPQVAKRCSDSPTSSKSAKKQKKSNNEE